MGIATLHALPRERQFFAKEETSFGTAAQPAATDALKVLPGTQFGAATITRTDRMDNRATRDLLERITGNIDPVEFTIETYIMPSGAAGTAPDCGPLLKAAFGVETVVGSTSVTYSTTDTQSAQKSLTLVDNMSYVVSQHLIGAIVDKVKISGSGGEPPKFTFTGRAKNHILTGRSTLSGAFAGSTVTVADGSMFRAGSLVAIIDPTTLAVVDSNSGAGFPVASIATNAVTVTGSPAGTDAADIMVPWTPSQTTAGSPLSGKDLTTCTIGGTAVRVMAWEVELDNGYNLHADEAGQQTFTDRDEGHRVITCKLTFKARQDWAVFMAERSEFGAHAIVLALNAGAGKILTISLPYTEYEYEQISAPDNGVATFALPGRALGSAGNDALTAAFT